MASRRYCHVVRTDALEHWIILKLIIASGQFAITSGQMQSWTIRSFLDTDGRQDGKFSSSGRMLLTDERPEGNTTLHNSDFVNRM
jgi:hypothetical protein